MKEFDMEVYYKDYEEKTCSRCDRLSDSSG